MRRISGFAAALLLVTVCSGCSMTYSHDNTDSGLAYIESMEYENALESFNKAIEAGENARQLYRGQGIAFYKLGRYEEAVEAFLKALKASNGIAFEMDYDTNYYLADCYSNLGQYEEAEKIYDSILALKDKEKDAYYLRGICRLAESNHDSAYEDFTKAISLDSRDIDKLVMIYKALSDYGYEEEGLAILQTAMEKADQYMSNYEKGQISFYLGNNAEAQNYLEQARNERDTEKAPVVLLLGLTAEKQGDYNYAVSVYKTFLENDPEHADIYNQLGLCQIKMGDYEGAVASFESGILLGDESVMQALMLNEITAYEYKGDFAVAKSLMETYIQRYPGDEEAQREYEFLSTR
ncbi:MAG: tetratricopeptide repeat protein [Butyrivibrio sp.]|nr:tetratricopeptide repeat protein [Butyrivibrio sp.]